MKKLKCPLEREEAKTFVDWARLHPICKNHLVKVQNEQKTSKYVGRKLNQQGRLKGAADFFLSYPSKDKHGLWIELKRRDKAISKPTDHQFTFLVNQTIAGYAAFVAWGAEEAIKIVEEYLSE